MDTARWAQGGIGVVKKPSMDGGSGSSSMMGTIRSPPPPSAPATQSQSQSQQLVERRARPVKEQALHCPRCNSTNTKFCYYNNYSLTQPRYFCKTCRRYWTEGGSLRNVPVGGGSRKNKRHSSSSSAPATSSAKISNTQPPTTMTSSSLPIPQSKAYQGQDLNLAFPNSAGFPGLIGGGGFAGSISGGELSAMELLRSTGVTARPGLGPLVHMSMAPETGAVYGAAGFGLHDFSSPGAAGYIGNGDSGNGMQEGGGRWLFPFGELKQGNVESGNEDGDEQNRDLPIFWSGANLGGGGGSW